MNKIYTFLAVFSIVVLFGGRLSAQTDTITILHLNDSHSGLMPSGPRTGDLRGTRGGIARAASVIGYTKATEKNVLTLHAGDFSVGDIFYNAYFGVPELQILASLGLDAMAVGNHEFDLTPATLKNVLDTAFKSGIAYPLLSANCMLEDSTVRGLKKYIQPYFIKTFGSTKVGIFGMTTPETNLLSQPSPAFIDTNLIQIASLMVDTLKSKGCKVIILLSHLGYNLDSVVASYVSGISIIVGGHDHYVFALPRKVVNISGDTIPIVQAGAHYSHIGRMDIEVKGARVRILNYSAIPLDQNVPEEPTIKSSLDTLSKGVESMFGPVYSKMLTIADRDFDELAENLDLPGEHDTPIGNIVTDAFRAKTGADIAIEVGGSTADKLYKGPIVGADIFRTVGYGYNTDNGLGYRLATFKMTGTALATGLEFGLTDIGQNDEFLVQTSGMKYSYDPGSPAYARLRNVMVGGEALDTGKIYTVAANEFAAMFLAMIGVPYSDLKIFKDTSEFQVISDFVAKRDTIKPVVEGRVKAGKLTVKPGALQDRQMKQQVYPNPCTGSINLNFAVNERTPISIKLYSVCGVEIADLLSQTYEAGVYSVMIDTGNLASGAYLLEIKTAFGVKTSTLYVNR